MVVRTSFNGKLGDVHGSSCFTTQMIASPYFSEWYVRQHHERTLYLRLHHRARMGRRLSYGQSTTPLVRVTSGTTRHATARRQALLSSLRSNLWTVRSPCAPKCTYPSIHLLHSAYSLKITVGCLRSTQPSIRTKACTRVGLLGPHCKRKGGSIVHSRLFEIHSLSHLEHKSRHLASFYECPGYTCRLPACV